MSAIRFGVRRRDGQAYPKPEPGVGKWIYSIRQADTQEELDRIGIQISEDRELLDYPELQLRLLGAVAERKTQLDRGADVDRFEAKS